MAISVCFHFTLFVAALYISYQGVSGQVLECGENAVKSCVDSFKIPADGEKICRSVDTYYNCIENFMEQCGIGEDVMVHFRERFAKYKCSAPAVSVPGSAPGLPAVSALCLLMTAFFHMLL
ncbi:uncharacterized protein LOC111123606 isoform X2 [Crassostrea virginica]